MANPAVSSDEWWILLIEWSFDRSYLKEDFSYLKSRNLLHCLWVLVFNFESTIINCNKRQERAKCSCKTTEAIFILLHNILKKRNNTKCWSNLFFRLTNDWIFSTLRFFEKILYPFAFGTISESTTGWRIILLPN